MRSEALLDSIMSQDLTEVNLNAIDTENEPTYSITLSETAAAPDDPSDDDAPAPNDDDNIDNYDGINWKRLPDLQKPHHSLKRTPSYIYKYGYRCQSRVKFDQIIFICKYCHIHKIIDYGGPGRYDITKANTAAATH